ncbi:hypothetical protein GAR05_06171 [Micromonospora saelicesensis]|uniref:Uncharacterized protein n=1 Tax=Micromonospora saelicesensis TaxID=285676 RepID=A0ABX9CAX5_9ACTN|nr:hypothetical protein [Micromonospora saelicesensis]RAN92679.1 hypothetical protein GAR05_06171 [Micromonospora saelicesensis]
MNTLSARICTAIFAPMPFTAAWEIALYAAVDGQPPMVLIAVGGVPMLATVVAGVAILLDEFGAAESAAPVPVPRRPAVEPPRRKELAR